MSQATQSPKSEVVQFIRSAARDQGIELVIHDELARIEDDWLYMPTYATGANAYDRATKLQDIEDAWNRQQPPRLPHLMIVPTRD